MQIEILIFQIIALVFSVILHEVSHGYVADRLGDPTARLAGRLTLNPIPHIDPFGSILLPGLMLLSGLPFIIGAAKPVPYNPYNLRGRNAEALVAFAGPAVNLVLALIFGLIVRFGAEVGLSDTFLGLSLIIVVMNIALAFFNLLPIPPLDGSKVIEAILPYSLAESWRRLRAALEAYGIFVLIIALLVFGTVLLPAFSVLIRLIVSLLTGVSI